MKHRRRGAGLLLVLLVGSLILVLGLMIGTLSSMSLNVAEHTLMDAQAQALARAAVADAIAQINQNVPPPPPKGSNLADAGGPHPAETALQNFRYLFGREDRFPGTVSVTFDSGQPWHSVDNLTGSAPRQGSASMVPPFSVDLVVTTQIHGQERHYEAVLRQVWNYAAWCQSSPVVASGSSLRGSVFGHLPTARAHDPNSNGGSTGPPGPNATSTPDPTIAGSAGAGSTLTAAGLPAVALGYSYEGYRALAFSSGSSFPDVLTADRPSSVLGDAATDGNQNAPPPDPEGISQQAADPIVVGPGSTLSGRKRYAMASSQAGTTATGLGFSHSSQPSDPVSTVLGLVVENLTGSTRWPDTSQAIYWPVHSHGGGQQESQGENQDLMAFVQAQASKGQVLVFDPSGTSLSGPELQAALANNNWAPDPLLAKLGGAIVGTAKQATIETAFLSDPLTLENGNFIFDYSLRPGGFKQRADLLNHLTSTTPTHHLVVSNAPGSGQQATGSYELELKGSQLTLNDAVLFVTGDLDLYQLTGNNATLLVKGGLRLAGGHLDAGDKGMVIVADNVLVEGEGHYRGLIVSRGLMDIRGINPDSPLQIQGALLASGTCPPGLSAGGDDQAPNAPIQITNASVAVDPQYTRAINSFGTLGLSVFRPIP